ncbi:AAA family ATPase [Pseudoglutamicibacter albus]|uniref:AAA family ATPase n=1 Tax=Pseudoglutamicibacter albus TaxID=98671 RepID=UPI003608D1A0
MRTEETTRTFELSDEGSHFYRTDFQVHTPRDGQWDGTRPNDRDKWADSFVAAARKKGLNAVAISDHHDFAYFPHIKKAAAREKLPDGTNLRDENRLIVFPALELTLEVPGQAIMILDADFPENRLDDVLRALHFEPVDPNLNHLPVVEALPDSRDVSLLQEKLDNHDWLRGRYIILPNVTPDGHKTFLRTSFQSIYRNLPSVGGYIDGSFDAKKLGKKQILDGKNREWGSKRLAFFQTSDTRDSEFSKLGEHTTWVKWSKPTAEALRQACLAQDSRISQAPPAMPNAWISRVIVSDSKFMGPVDVKINPQYTALIGGRGTGKSTIMEYLRWALCDSRVNENDNVEDTALAKHTRNLIESTLKDLDAYVEVHCVVNGVTHVVRRYASDGKVDLKIGESKFDNVTSSEVESLLPIQAYSQKQLSSVAVRTDELLRFLTTPIQRELEENSNQEKEVISRLRKNHDAVQRHQTVSSEINSETLRKDSHTTQILALRQGLTGLSQEDHRILDHKPDLDHLVSLQSAWHQQAASTQDSLTTLFDSLDSWLQRNPTPPTLPKSLSTDLSNDVDALFTATREALAVLHEEGSRLLDNFRGLTRAGGKIAKLSQALESKLSACRNEYAAVKQRSSTHETTLTELARLEAQQQTSHRRLQELRVELEGLGDPHGERLKLRSKLAGVREERAKLLHTECEKLKSSSEGMIRATLSSNCGFQALQEEFKGLIQGLASAQIRLRVFPEPFVRAESAGCLGASFGRA